MAEEARRPWLRPLKIAISLGLLVALAFLVDTARLGAVLSAADLKLLLLSPPVWLLGAGFAALRWRVVLRATGVEFGWLRCWSAYLIGSFYSLFLPGAVGGDAARVAIVVRDVGAEVGASTGTVVLERVGGALGLVGFVLGSTLLWPERGAALIGGSATALQAAAGALLVATPLGWVAARRWMPRTGVPFVVSLLRVLDGASLRVLGAVLALSMAFQFVRFVAVWLVALALGLDLGLADILLVFPLVFLASMLPISLGGLGVREASAAALLAPLGIAAGPAALLGFSVYANAVGSASLGGLLQLRRAQSS